MRKIIFLIFLFITAFQLTGTAQNPDLSIRVAQYYIITERVYKFHPDAGSMPANASCINNSFFETVTNSQTIPVNLRNHTPFYLSHNFQFNAGDSVVLYDTVAVVQAQFPVDSLILRTKLAYPYNSCTLFEPFEGFGTSVKLRLPVRYPYFDTTATKTISYQADNIFDVRVRIQVRPNNDLTYNLPTHDRIELFTTDPAVTAYPTASVTWQFMAIDTAISNWRNFKGTPSILTGFNHIAVSGEDIVGTDSIFYYLNKPVFVRALYTLGNNSLPSKVSVFTMRLSAPHIINTFNYDLDCFGDNSGSVAVRFDRPLIPGERINVLLRDTATQSDFSMFNITSFDASNKVIFPRALPAGTYNVQLLGKFNNSHVFDTILHERDTNELLYIAINSIYFDTSFNAEEGDEFEARVEFSTGSNVTYTGSLTHESFTAVAQPSKINFTATVLRDVYCKGGNNGAISIAAHGSNGQYHYGLKKAGQDSITWRQFEDTTYNNVETARIQIADTLSAGTYQVYLRDRKGCVMRDSLGNEVVRNVTIHEPSRALTFDLLDIRPITSYDSSNGKVTARISGGTPAAVYEPQLNYFFQWLRVDNGNSQVVLDAGDLMLGNDSIAHFQKTQIPEGHYILRIWDRDRAAVPLGYNSAGCMLEQTIIFVKPDSLQASIGVQQPITCHDSVNAVLKAIALGGIQIDSIKYRYTWYKETSPGIYEVIGNDSLLRNTAPGAYKLEVKDKYDNIKLSQPFILTAPAPLAITLAADSVSCYFSTDGSITATVSGGTAPYYYQWSTGDNTPFVDSVSGGNYLLMVRDSFHCQALDTVSVFAPYRILTQHSIQQVTCRNSCTAQISITNITGGTAPYTYLWSTGHTTSSISDLCAGEYWYKVIDANGCYDSVGILLENPDTLSLTLAATRGICVGQRIRLDAHVNYSSPVSYVWKRNDVVIATTDTISVTQEGTYVAIVTSNTGCMVTDTTVLYAVNDTIQADFIVSSQAFAQQNTVLVNVSVPMPDSVVWVLPAGVGADLINSTRTHCEVRFTFTGQYLVGMKAYYNSGCIDEIYKTVTVLDPHLFPNLGNQANAFLKKFVVYPNPNNGDFTVDLVFNDPTQAKLRLVNLLTNQTVDTKQVSGQKTYTIQYALNNTLLPNQTYVLVIETPKGNFVHKVVKQ